MTGQSISQQWLCKLLMPNEKGQRVAKRVGHEPSLTLRCTEHTAVENGAARERVSSVGIAGENGRRGRYRQQTLPFLFTTNVASMWPVSHGRLTRFMFVATMRHTVRFQFIFWWPVCRHVFSFFLRRCHFASTSYSSAVVVDGGLGGPECDAALLREGRLAECPSSQKCKKKKVRPPFLKTLKGTPVNVGFATATQERFAVGIESGRIPFSGDQKRCATRIDEFAPNAFCSEYLQMHQMLFTKGAIDCVSCAVHTPTRALNADFRSYDDDDDTKSSSLTGAVLSEDIFLLLVPNVFP